MRKWLDGFMLRGTGSSWLENKPDEGEELVWG
jgi:hypothetical protein